AQALADIRLSGLHMGLYLWSLVTDHRRQQRWLVCHPSLTAARERELLERLQNTSTGPGNFALRAPFSAEQSRQQYLQSFERIQHYIRAGDCYQVNLAQRFSAACQGDPLSAYQRLRQACPTPFAAYLEAPDYSLLSLSPERFLKVRDGQVETRPIKGTRPRGIDAETDSRLAEELRNSPKDRAENLMIVDLLRNDLGRSCAFGSVRAPALFSLPRQRFRKVRDGQVEPRPIEGRRPRGIDAETDSRRAEELRHSPKDRAENLMIVDLLRNDLGRSCAFGSVRVPELFSIESY